MEVVLRHRSPAGTFYALTIEERVQQLEDKVTTLQNRTCLRSDVSITTNIERWFKTHTVLATMQFTYELRALNTLYTEAAIRTTLWRQAKIGYLVRLRDGLYAEAK